MFSKWSNQAICNEILLNCNPCIKESVKYSLLFGTQKQCLLIILEYLIQLKNWS